MTSNMEFLSGASSSTSSSCSFTPGGRAIDRYNPIITDDKRRGSISASAPTTPCTNTRPIKPTHQNKPSSDRRKNRKLPKQTPTVDGVEKSVSKPSDLMMKATASTTARPGTEFISPPESSRYLLDESSFIDVLSDFDLVSKSAQKKADEVDVLVDPNPKLDDPVKDPKPGLPGSSDQVVVLMVSLHCRGCERKMKKHLSKMPSTHFTL